MITEFVGLPGSGKSTILKLLNKNNSNLKKNFTYIEFLFNNFYKKNYLNYYSKSLIYILSKFRNLIFLQDKKINKFYQINIKFLFIRIFIFFVVKSFNKKDYFFYKSYKNLLGLSAHSQIRKKRMEIYFLLSYLGFYLFKKIKLSDTQIIDDEGFYQKILIKYSDFSLNKKKILHGVKKYLNFCPKLNNALIIYNSRKKIILRVKKRNQGYTYIKEDINNNLLDWSKVMSYIISDIRKKKFNTVFFKNKNIQKFKDIQSIRFLNI